MFSLSEMFERTRVTGITIESRTTTNQHAFLPNMGRSALAALVILGACSGSSPDAPKPVPKPVRPGKPPKVIRGGHSATIEIVAVGDDGNVAATQDGMGGTRLWPALDGSAEPIVVRIAAGRELVVGRVGTNDGFVIATLDDAGTIDMVELAGDGATRSRKQITGDAVAEDIAMTRAGLLALRADQSLVLLAPNGTERSRLVPPPGERIASVIARNGHAIALMKGAKVHARTITLEPIGWGAESAALELATKRVVLAPNGKRIAAATDKGGIAVTELATGATIATVCRPAPGRPLVPTDLASEEVPDFVTRFQLNNTAAIGFVDDTSVVCFVGGRIETWSTAGKPARVGATHDVGVPELVAIANGLVATAEHESLELEAHGTTQYLGYGLANPSMVRVGPAGITLGNGRQPLLVDRTLKAKRRLDLPVDANELDDVLPLDALHVLVSRSDTGGDAIVRHVKLLDLATHRVQALQYAPLDYELRYEPSTHLLALADARGAWVVPLDGKTWTFGVGYHLTTTAKDVHLVDPALANGLTAIGVRAEHDRTYVDEFATSDLTYDHPVAPRHSYEVFGDPVAVDRAGHVFVADGDTIAGYTSGEHDNATRVAQWKQLGRAVVRPSPDATQLLVLGDNRLRMLDAHGAQQWMIPAATAIDIAWVDGEPFARFAAGLAKLDLATGALLERACGWSFGLSPQRFEVGGDSQSVCDAP
jgi:hypothetical protein